MKPRLNECDTRVTFAKKRKHDFGMSHWELIVDFLDSLTLCKLSTVCKLFAIRSHENNLACQDEIDLKMKLWKNF